MRYAKLLALATTVSAFAFVTLAASSAEARWGRRGMHRGHHGKRHHRRHMRGMHMMKGFALRCSHKLFHSPAEHLKQKLGLSDAQITKIKKYRNNVWFKKAATKSKIATLRVKLRLEMEKDLPEMKKVLKLMRQMRQHRGTMMEEKLKAKLWSIAVLTPEQRKKLRSTCGRFGKHRMGRRWRRGPGMRGPGPRGPGMRGRGMRGPAKRSAYERPAPGPEARVASF